RRRSRGCLELASRKPSWPAVQSHRINRPDIWTQAIRSDRRKNGSGTCRDSIWTKKGAWLFGARVAETILASGPKSPHQQAGHMDASDPIRPSKKLLWHGVCPHMAEEGRVVVWSSRRGNHLGQRSKVTASTGRTYGRKRSDQTVEKTLVARGPSTYGSLLSRGRRQHLRAA